MYRPFLQYLKDFWHIYQTLVKLGKYVKEIINNKYKYYTNVSH